MFKEIYRASKGVPELVVMNSGVVDLTVIGDQPDGVLNICQVGKQVSFPILCFFVTNEIHRPEALRGKHAHKELEQVIFCVSGSFELMFDDGENQQVIIMDTVRRGIRLGPKLWHEMTNFSDGCIMLVVASDEYKESDYIRNYDEFLEYIKTRSV
ncbi:MAG: WxcM-like protein [Microgenomates group bacterium GW2011_GWA2_39_19]|nr:MAG: WxcM-like protein [Microgenomates group bacterium GW2011_GWA2_39_19]